MPRKSDNQLISGNFNQKDILSLDQFDRQSIEQVFTLTTEMSHIAKHAHALNLLDGTIATLLFYEPSSRTFGSFSAAVKQLGGATIEFQDPLRTSSAVKGETLEDSIRVFEAYSDIIIMRHPQVGSVKAAADAAFFVPVINAGDGIGEHPTQALLDMYTIHEKHKTLDNITGVLVGDLKNGRTIHSLLKGLSLYKNITIYLLAPKELRVQKEYVQELKKRGLKLTEIDSLQDIPKNAQFWYWTRVQKERFSDPKEYEKVNNQFILSKKVLKQFGNNNLIIMHPLPRVGEILTEVDADERAAYLRSEIRNGMYIRMALISLVLGKH